MCVSGLSRGSPPGGGGVGREEGFVSVALVEVHHQGCVCVEVCVLVALVEVHHQGVGV